MPNTKFDAKSFNPEAFKYMVGRVPNLKLNELRKSRALAGDPDIRDVFSSQNGTAYARIAMRGLLDGDAVNYDGETDITATSTKTFEQGVIVIGRAKAWVEKDFSYDITDGVDFMQNIAEQVAGYWEGIDQGQIISILKGIFAMTGTKNLEFVNNHTFNVSGNMTATTLNSATQKACGDNKKKFTLVFMHSAVATNLENLKLLTFLTQTDKDGLTREIGLATWNGKLVLVDDDMPTFGVAAEGATYAKTSDTVIDPWKTYYTRSGSSPNYVYTAVDTPVVANIGDYYEPSAYDTAYVTFVLGNGAIRYENIGAKVPYEMARDPATKGGQDTLYTRQRKVFSPFGISYEKASQASLSPTDAELADGSNWTLVHSGESVAADRTYINHRAIPIARIISLG